MWQRRKFLSSGSGWRQFRMAKLSHLLTFIVWLGSKDLSVTGLYFQAGFLGGTRQVCSSSEKYLWHICRHWGLKNRLGELEEPKSNLVCLSGAAARVSGLTKEQWFVPPAMTRSSMQSWRGKKQQGRLEGGHFLFISSLLESYFYLMRSCLNCAFSLFT